MEGLFAIAVGIGVLFLGPPLLRRVTAAFIDAFGFERPLNKSIPLQVAAVYALGALLIIGGIYALLAELWNRVTG